jgi:hypothetical protein
MAGRTVRQYIYTDLGGKPRLRKLRKEPKAFYMQSWLETPRRSWWGRGIHADREAFADSAMYHLPELLWALNADEPVWWCEGEKDADALRGVGLVATSHWQGATSATRGQCRWFATGTGPIRLVADVDDAGAACVIHRRRLLLAAGVARSRIRIVKPPHPHKDAAAAIEAGVSPLRFRRPREADLMAAARRYKPARKGSRRRGSSDWMRRAS